MNQPANLTHRDIFGISLAFCFNIVTSLSFIIVSQFEQTVSPVVLIFYNFIILTLLFSLLALPRYRSLWQLMKREKRTILYSNLITIFAWWPLFFCLKYMMPLMVIVAMFGLIPLFTLLLPTDKSKWHKKTPQDIFFSSMIALLALSAIIYNTVAIQDLSSPDKVMHYLEALTCILLGAVGNAMLLVNVKNMSLKGFSITQMIAVRFYGLVIGSAVVISFSSLSFVVTHAELLKIFLIFFISTVLPILLTLKSIQLTSPLYVSFVDTLQPMMTYLVQLFYLQSSFSEPLLLLVTLITAVAILYSIFKSKALKQLNFKSYENSNLPV